MKKGTRLPEGEGGRGREGGREEEGHQFTGHSSLSVGGKTQNSEVLMLAWTTLIAGPSEKGYLVPTEGKREGRREKQQIPPAPQVPLVATFNTH